MKKIANMHKKTLEDILALEPGERRKFHDDISLVIVDISPQFSHQWTEQFYMFNIHV